MAGEDRFESDEEAVAAALSGRQDGYRLLLDRYRADVFRVVRGQIGNEDEALDITQESFISAFAALRRYDRSRSFRTWILAIAVNKCRDWNRRRTVRKLFTFALPIEAARDVPGLTADPEQALASSDAVDRIRSALSDLPQNLREPLVLCALEEMSQDEAADILGISRKAVETRIYRARQKLSALLEG